MFFSNSFDPYYSVGWAVTNFHWTDVVATNSIRVSGRNYHLQLDGCCSRELRSWEKDRPRAFLRFPRASRTEILRVCCHPLTTSEARGYIHHRSRF